jgi:dienelactone hydrolase
MGIDLPGFDRFEFAAGGISKPVYRRGDGPGVIVMHELPGMVPECVRLAEAIAAAGYAVYLPLFLGTPGQKPAFLGPIIKLCISREFALWRAGQKSPITDWLRSLAGRVRGETGGRSVGAIGMCLTGSFALAMLLEDGVAAPVVCEPSLPVFVPLVRGKAVKSDLGLSPEQLAGARERVGRDEIPVLGFRFEKDMLCPKERFETLRREFGDHFLRHEIPGDRHSVLTSDFHRMSEADQERVWSTLVTFLNDRLKGGEGTVPPKPTARQG